MSTCLRPLLTLIATLAMVLALVLSMLGHGFARAQPPASSLHAVVICAAEGGEAVIMVDARGSPSAPDQPCTQLCPDCLVMAGPGLKPVAWAEAQAAPWRLHAPAGGSRFIARHGASWAAARGPPNES